VGIGDALARVVENATLEPPLRPEPERPEPEHRAVGHGESGQRARGLSLRLHAKRVAITGRDGDEAKGAFVVRRRPYGDVVAGDAGQEDAGVLHGRVVAHRRHPALHCALADALRAGAAEEDGVANASLTLRRFAVERPPPAPSGEAGPPEAASFPPSSRRAS